MTSAMGQKSSFFLISLGLLGLASSLCQGAPLQASKPADPIAVVRRSTEPISIISPGPNDVLPNIRNKWVMGSVSDPTANFEINGQTVAVHPGGGFLAWLPVQSGTFTFNASLTRDGSTSTYHSSVFITPPPAPFPGKPLAIDGSSLWPSGDMELRPGDWALARMKATPGQKAQFRLPKHSWQPLTEVDALLGIYEGTYVVRPGEEAEAEAVEYRVGTGWSPLAARSHGKVSLNPGTLSIAMIKGLNPVTVYAAPNEGAILYAQPGIKLIINGRSNGFSRIALSGGQIGWIESKNIDFLPANTLPPRAATDTIGVKSGDNTVSVNIGLTERVPFSIEESDDLKSLTVRLHYTAIHTNWIVYASTDDFVSEVRVKQESGGIAAVTIRLKAGKTLWGYHPQYAGSALKLDLRQAPVLALAPASPLAGLRIVLDPGHMPSAPGRLGPLGTQEMTANFAIAKAVETLLLKHGATPILTRASNEEEVALTDRARIAWDKRGDLFVSIHNNGLNDSENPFLSIHGYQIFYYHPHSLALAQAIYRSYQQKAALRDEKLRFGDYLVLRISEMPSILTESAYMNYPDQELMLFDPKFQSNLAQTIVAGIKSFLEEERARQKIPLPAAPKSKRKH